VDVRVIAATHVNLAQLVQERKFRADLYYRLNVFPISIPPLRERRDDIPQFVWHFVRKFAFKMNKDIQSIPNEAMEMIKQHDWPGNIRELQNFIERAMILSPGTVLRPPLGDLKVFTKSVDPQSIQTLAEAERHHIVEAIRQAGGVIGGPKGAAARLGMARTTLLYRMRKLGIGQPPPTIATPQAQAASASA
jgi:transcriptional regulator with GAF, ATPase, and Fis domain